MTGRIETWLLAATKQLNFERFGSDDFALFALPTPESELEKRRSDLRNGLTDKQRLFLFGKLGGLTDKDAALAAGYSVSVAKTQNSESGNHKSLQNTPESKRQL